MQKERPGLNSYTSYPEEMSEDLLEVGVRDNKLTLDTDLTDDWNTFIDLILSAEELWNTRLMDKSASDIAKAPGGLPKIYANYKRSKFNNIAPRLISFARGSGGLREFLVGKER